MSSLAVVGKVCGSGLVTCVTRLGLVCGNASDGSKGEAGGESRFSSGCTESLAMSVGFTSTGAG